MHVILSTERRPEPSATEMDAVKRVVVRAGQVVRVGSTEWADLCVASDDQLQEQHFQVECFSDACRVTPLAGAAIAVNGAEIEGVYEARDGDRIAAGQSEFLLTFPYAQAPEQTNADAPPTPPSRDIVWPNVQHQKAAGVTDSITLGDDALLLANEHEYVDGLLPALMEAELYSDAIQLMAHALPKRSAIWWCMQSLGEAAMSADTETADAIRQWCEDPSEANRVACGNRAQASSGDHPTSSLAWAVFYTGGSIVPDGNIDAPPGDELTGHMITSALAIAACGQEDAAVALRSYLDKAPAIAEGNVPWEIDADFNPA